jgi:hypothetical protein
MSATTVRPTANDFHFDGIDGKQLRLADFRGKALQVSVRSKRTFRDLVLDEHDASSVKVTSALDVVLRAPAA